MKRARASRSRRCRRRGDGRCTRSGEVLHPADGGGPVVLQLTDVRVPPGSATPAPSWPARCRCWGDDGDGRLGVAAGDASTGQPPMTVAGGPWVAPAVGSVHSCALASDGSVWCWGGNANGQLGSGDRTSRARAPPGRAARQGGRRPHRASSSRARCWPTPAPGAGATTGRGSSGSATCTPATTTWSRSSSAARATGRSSPPARDTAAASARRVGFTAGGGTPSRSSVRDARSRRRCARRSRSAPTPTGSRSAARSRRPARASGTAACGAGARSRAARSRSATSRPGPTPAQVPVYSDWSAATVGTFHTCGLRPGGEIWCAGRNTEGQIGAPDFVDALPNMMRADPTAGWIEVRAGRFFTCARKADDSVWCMGSNTARQLAVDPATLDRSAAMVRIPL